MRFAAPQFFWLIPVITILLTLFLVWAWRVKQRLIGQFVQSRLLANLTVGVSQSRQKLRMVLLVITTMFALLALTRPQWGYVWQEVRQQGLDIIIAIDASRSMLAQDVAPNRLARAKLAAMDLMTQARNDRLGLVAFAGTAFLQAPLTLDEEAFRQNVEAIDPANMPRGGTALAAAIETALAAFEKESENHKILVLFTDGEDHDADAQTIAAAETAAKAGMKIFTIGVGSTDGEILQVKDGNGNYIKSRLNETLLQKIATIGSGFYLPLRGANPIETLYSRGLAPLPKSDPSTKLSRVYRERYYWPLALAVLCLVAETFFPERKRVRQVAPPSAPVSSGIQKAAVAACILLTPLIAMSSPSGALREYDAGNFELAQKEYERLAEKKTNDYRLFYNAGTAAYQAKQFDAAEKHFSEALNSPEIASDLRAQEHAFFNLGNTQFKQGSEKWGHAVTNFSRALKLDPADTNAAVNLAYVQRKLEELKKQQQQQKQDGKDDQKQNQDKQDNQQNKPQDQKDQKNKKDQQSAQQQQQNQQQGNKDDQQKQHQAEKDKETQQREAKAKEDKEKQEQAAAAAKKSDDQKDNDEEQQAVVPGQMTKQEAARILNAQQENEKPLIFTPDDQKKQNPQGVPVKDW